MSRTAKPRFLWMLMPMWGLFLGLVHVEAHPQFALSTANRYGTLALTASFGARVFYTFMIGDVPAHSMRKQADRNGDGTLDAQEQAGLAQTLRAQLADLTVSVDGQKVPLTFEAPPLSLPDPRVSPIAFAYELSATLPIGDGAKEHLVRYDDRIGLPPVGDVEVRVEEGPGVRVLQTWEGAAPPAVAPEKIQLLYLTQGPPRSSLSDRSVSVRFVRQAGKLAGAAKKSRFTIAGCAGGERS